MNTQECRFKNTATDSQENNLGDPLRFNGLTGP